MRRVHSCIHLTVHSVSQFSLHQNILNIYNNIFNIYNNILNIYNNILNIYNNITTSTSVLPCLIQALTKILRRETCPFMHSPHSPQCLPVFFTPKHPQHIQQHLQHIQQHLKHIQQHLKHLQQHHNIYICSSLPDSSLDKNYNM